MNTFMEALKTEQKRIQRFIDLSVPPAPAEHAGSLHLERRGNGIYCYQHCYERGRRTRKKYLGTLQSPAVRAHVRSRFLQERHASLCKNQTLLSELEQKYRDYENPAVIASLPAAYRAAFGSNSCKGWFDDRYEALRQWADADYERNPTPFPNAANFARDGTRVRSKGECIHYNLLLEHGVLFRYDGLLICRDQVGQEKWLYPDFMIKCFDGSFIIIEHLGWISKKNYALDFGEKCYWYLQEGFILGKNFFVTSDDLQGGTDSEMIARIAHQVERQFYGF